MKVAVTLYAVLALNLATARAEAPITREAAFKAKDVDADGKISKVEYRHRTRGCERFEDFSPYAFERLDKDKNGYLSLGEFHAPK